MRRFSIERAGLALAAGLLLSSPSGAFDVATLMKNSDIRFQCPDGYEADELEFLAASGNSNAKYYLGVISMDEQLFLAIGLMPPGRADYKKTKEMVLIKEAADGVFAPAQHLWSILLGHSSMEGAKYGDAAAAQGYSAAEYSVGFRFDTIRTATSGLTEAFQWYEKAAAKNHARSLARLGIAYQYGQGLYKQDYIKSMEFYEKAALQLDPIALERIGYMYEKGFGVAADASLADWYYTMADSLAYATVFYKEEFLKKRKIGPNMKGDTLYQGPVYGQLGRKTLNEEFFWIDSTKINKTLYQAYEKKDFVALNRELAVLADRGNPHAQFALALNYMDGLGVARDLPKAAQLIQRSAERGHVSARLALASLYRDGRVLEKNQEKAAKLLSELVRFGHPTAATNLAHMYYLGEGVARNEAEGARLLTEISLKSCDKDGLYQLAMIYALGKGVNQDIEKAAIYYRMAAGQGHGLAQLNLGALYATGRGVAVDDARAVKWWSRAAAQGVGQAQSNLGLMYAMGRGTPRNDIKAYVWLSMAASSADPVAVTKATELRRTVAERLTPDALEQADRLLMKCQNVEGLASGECL